MGSCGPTGDHRGGQVPASGGLRSDGEAVVQRMKGTSPSRVIRAVAGYGIKVPRWEVRSLINSLVLWKEKSMAIVSVGIDLAKNVFAVHGVDESGKPALVRPSVSRTKLLELIASLPPCLIGMEACSGAHHWAREFQQFCHTVRLMAPKFVIPYRLSGKRGKNDAADAAAICEAVTRPNMRFVPRPALARVLTSAGPAPPAPRTPRSAPRPPRSTHRGRSRTRSSPRAWRSRSGRTCRA